jgi:hypothetical protein
MKITAYRCLYTSGRDMEIRIAVADDWMCNRFVRRNGGVSKGLGEKNYTT